MKAEQPTDIAFTPFALDGGFIGHNGPYFWGTDPAGEFVYGFQSDDRHGNPNGVLHGAAITAFVDTFLGHTVVMRTARPCATVALNTQFVAGVATGPWIGGRARIRQLTRTMAFLDAEAFAGDTLLLTATAIFRLFEPRSG
ncbi:MAG: PaaI family thioesterase [Reyranellaceae bacterium]